MIVLEWIIFWVCAFLITTIFVKYNIWYFRTVLPKCRIQEQKVREKLIIRLVKQEEWIEKILEESEKSHLM